MKKVRLDFQDIVSLIVFFVIVAFFAIASGGKILSPYNLSVLIEQSLMTIVVGCGTVFVVAQGSIDLSLGVNLALSSVLATWAANEAGAVFLIPVALLVGLGVGIINGIIVSRYKVPSFMVTISMLIGIRGIVNYIQAGASGQGGLGTQKIPEAMTVLAQPAVRYTAFAVLVIAMIYIFEFTKIGKYSKAIGENETTAGFVGVPVPLMKIVVFALSGLMVGFGSLFNLSSIGGTSNQIGVFFEMRVAMAIFLGGVAVTGGNSAKIYKVFLGSFAITIIVNGLALIGLSATQYSQSIQGLLLLLILFVVILSSSRQRRTGKQLSDMDEKPEAAELESEQTL